MGRSFRYSRPSLNPDDHLIDYLSVRFSYLSTAAWQAHIDAGYLSVNNAVMHDAQYTLQQGDTIEFDPPRELEPPVDDVHITVLFEDDDLVVCVKNGEIPVTEGGRYCKNTLTAVLRRKGTHVFYNEKTKVGEGRQPAPALSTTLDSGSCRIAKLKRARSDVSGDGEPPAKEGLCPTRDPSKQGPAFFPIHRLDKETSGVLVLGKTLESTRQLSSQFERQSQEMREAVEGLLRGSCAVEKVVPERIMRQLEQTKTFSKQYIAILVGCVPPGTVYCVTGRIGPVAQHPTLKREVRHQKLKKLKMVCDGSAPTPSSSSAGDGGSAEENESPSVFGKFACTVIRFRATDAVLNVSVAEVELITGRTHQIRVHCAHLGYPLLGDKLYSTRHPGRSGFGYPVDDEVYLARVRETEIPYQRDELAPLLLCRRHLLHAASLSFTHPVTGLPMKVIEMPGEWFMTDLSTESEDARSRLMNLLVPWM